MCKLSRINTRIEKLDLLTSFKVKTFYARGTTANRAVETGTQKPYILFGVKVYRN